MTSLKLLLSQAHTPTYFLSSRCRRVYVWCTLPLVAYMHETLGWSGSILFPGARTCTTSCFICRINIYIWITKAGKSNAIEMITLAPGGECDCATVVHLGQTALIIYSRRSIPMVQSFSMMIRLGSGSGHENLLMDSSSVHRQTCVINDQWKINLTTSMVRHLSSWPGIFCTTSKHLIHSALIVTQRLGSKPFLPRFSALLVKKRLCQA